MDAVGGVRGVGNVGVGCGHFIGVVGDEEELAGKSGWQGRVGLDESEMESSALAPRIHSSAMLISLAMSVTTSMTKSVTTSVTSSVTS